MSAVHAEEQRGAIEAIHEESRGIQLANVAEGQEEAVRSGRLWNTADRSWCQTGISSSFQV